MSDHTSKMSARRGRPQITRIQTTVAAVLYGRWCRRPHLVRVALRQVAQRVGMVHSARLAQIDTDSYRILDQKYRLPSPKYGRSAVCLLLDRYI